MVLAPFIFKVKAAHSLKGNWQTALLVSFFQGIIPTAIGLLHSTQVPDLTRITSWEQLWSALESVPLSSRYMLAGLGLLSVMVTPMLQLGCTHYFLCRMRGQELGFAGLFSRVRTWGKALWLTILVGVKIFLWSLLLVYPGIIAAIRYSMAPYYLAEDPSLSPWEAIKKSKNAMQHTKMSYFALYASFLGWMFLPLLLQTFLGSVSIILALVASQFMELFITTYMNGAFSAFYLAMSNPERLSSMTRSDPTGTGTRNTPFPFWTDQVDDFKDKETPQQDSDSSEEPSDEDRSSTDQTNREVKKEALENKDWLQLNQWITSGLFSCSY